MISLPSSLFLSPSFPFPLIYVSFFPLSISTVPTFASFLKEVDSPYEVHDYVRAYLGDTPQAKDFAKQFLERRAKQNVNQQISLQSQQLKNQQVSAIVSRFALFEEFNIKYLI